METFLFYFTNLGLPALVILTLAKAKYKSRAGIISAALLMSALLLFLYLWGQYSLVISHYFRYFLLVLITLTLWKAFKKWKLTESSLPNSFFSYLKFSLSAIVGILFSVLSFYAIQGQSYDTNAVELKFPLKSGNYYISSGGNSSVINNHFRNYPNSQQFALDINKINAVGYVSSTLMSSSSETHFIFGEDVYCPCSGTVMESQNDVPDNMQTSMQVDHEFGKGNFITLNCDNNIITLMHLQEGSVLAQRGQNVVFGQPLGKIGNSGFSMEPHLHIQAAKYQNDSTLVGIPIQFEGQELVRNDLVKAN